MKSGYRDQAVKCPCYHREDGQKIYCDSFAGDKASTATYLNSKEEKKLFKATLCKSAYSMCPIYKAVSDLNE